MSVTARTRRRRPGPVGRAGVRRVYDPPEPGEGRRFLVDRLWPRGWSRADAVGVTWLPEVAPSSELRRWYGHAPGRFGEFRRRYRAELDRNPAPTDPIAEALRAGPTTLLCAARDPGRANATVLAEWLADRFGRRGAGTGAKPPRRSTSRPPGALRRRRTTGP